MIACSVNQVSKMYGGNLLFDNISFEIQEGDRIGLVGRNGSGKTTLLKLLAGEETPDSGLIHWKKGVSVGYLAQIPDYHNELLTKELLKTAFSELLQMEVKLRKLEEAMSHETNEAKLGELMEHYGNMQDNFAVKGGYEIEASIEKIVNGLKIHDLLDQQYLALSGGEKTKVGLAFILLKNPDLLLLDEPTNHLDLVTVEWLGTFLQFYSGTVVVISHDRYFLDDVVNRILDLEDGKIGSNVKIGYLSQHVFSDFIDDTVIDAFRNEVRVTEEEARHILARFLFYGHMVFRKVSQLSGGERMRLRLAQLMHQDINLLILDEPTNHLDIDSREVLEDALEDYNGTILAVSHDRYFLNKLFEKMYWIESKQVYCLEGNYHRAREKMAEKRKH